MPLLSGTRMAKRLFKLATMSAEEKTSVARLLQLASPALPVGAFSYSQGLEAAVAAGVVHDADTTESWISDYLAYCIARVDAPIFLRLSAGWLKKDFSLVEYWNRIFLASRETAELRGESVQMGFSLRQLLTKIESKDPMPIDLLHRLEEVAFPTAFTAAAVAWRIDGQTALVGYLWSWLENQVISAVKLVPIGQTEGQRISFAIATKLTVIAEQAAALSDDEVGGFAPGLAILSSQHETQYTRLFRS